MFKTMGGVFIKTVEAGEIHGFKVTNTFPEQASDDEWTDFADSMSAVLKGIEACHSVDTTPA